MAAPARRKRIVLYGDSLTQRSFEPYGFGAALVRLSNVGNARRWRWHSRWFM